ncbi:unnamed protein product [Calypogeia fissa]
MGKRMLLVAALAAVAVQGVAARSDSDMKWAQMHGWLMWVSFGFLFPLSLILIRYNRPQRDPRATLSPGRVMLLFYLHIFAAILAVVAASGGVAILIRRDGGSFNYTHQRLGLALMIIVWMMPFIGLVRPSKGVTARPYWFVIHWVFGTGAVFLGIINCFIGINVYELVFKDNIRTLNIVFSCVLAVMVVAYFLQDKWGYILNQSASQNPHLGVKRSQTVGLVQSL